MLIFNVVALFFMHRFISLSLVAVFLLLGGLLGLSNPQTVVFNALSYQVQWPLSILMALAFVTGGLFAGGLMGWQLGRLRMQKSHLQKQLRKQAVVEKQQKDQWQVAQSEQVDQLIDQAWQSHLTSQSSSQPKLTHSREAETNHPKPDDLK